MDVFGELVDERVVETPYGAVKPLGLRTPASGPSVWVQPYTGTPTRTDPRAMIYAAQALGVRSILNWDTGIAINPLLQRGQSVIAVDFIDWTRHQPLTFGSALARIGRQLVACSRRLFVHTWLIRCARCCPGRRRCLFGSRWSKSGNACRISPVSSNGRRCQRPKFGPRSIFGPGIRLCYAGLVTIGDYSADQLHQPPRGRCVPA
ncbi:MAG: hypothetical protein R2867_21820 [Caldilineaceae bacterium]